MSFMTKIYLDNNATTGLDARVLEAMLPHLQPIPHNPSSTHSYGREAKAHLAKARASIAANLGCTPAELIFTSSGSESMNTLIRGLYSGGTILTTPLEHACILNTAKHFPVKYTSQEAIEAAISSDISLMVFSAVNGETGALLDLEKVASLAEQHRKPLIIDGVALLGRGAIKLYPGITAMGFSAHKIHGPKGVGLIYLKSGYKLNPLIAGGGQEHGLRAGTENLAGIVGFAKAIDLIDPADFVHMERLRDYFEAHLPAIVNGAEIQRIGNVSNLAFPEMDGEVLLMQLDQAGIAVSHGSACASGGLEPSHVLTAMGYSKERIRSSIRFSLSRTTTKDEIDFTIKTLNSLCAKGPF